MRLGSFTFALFIQACAATPLSTPPQGKPATQASAVVADSPPAASATKPAPALSARERYRDLVAAAKARGFVVSHEIWFGDEACALTFACAPDMAMETCEGVENPPDFALISPNASDLHEASSEDNTHALEQGTDGFRFELRHKGDRIVALSYHLPPFALGFDSYEYIGGQWISLEGELGLPCLSCAERGLYVDEQPVFRDNLVELTVASNGAYDFQAARGWVFEIWDGKRLSASDPRLRPLAAARLRDTRKRAAKLPRPKANACPLELIQNAVEIFTFDVATGVEPNAALAEVDHLVGRISTAHCNYPKGGEYVPTTTPWPDLRAQLLQRAEDIQRAVTAPVDAPKQ